MVDRPDLQKPAEILIVDLSAASDFYASPQAGAERFGVQMAALAVVTFIRQAAELLPPRDQQSMHRLMAPLLALTTALYDLDHGTVAPILKPTLFGNKPPVETAVRMARANAAAAMDGLIVGGESREQAARYVAHVIAGRPETAGIKRDLWKAVAHWRDEFNACNEEAVLYDNDGHLRGRIDLATFRHLVAQAIERSRAGVWSPRELRAWADSLISAADWTRQVP